MKFPKSKKKGEIRRKNLEMDTLNESYTSICPHCGHEISVPSSVLTVLVKIEDCHYDLKAASNPILYGHSCPLCKGNIIYNYYRG